MSGRVSVAEFEAILAQRLPMAGAMGMEVLEIGAGTARVRLPFREDFLRPGGTVVGVALMAVADVAMYAAVLGAVGPVELAVTTQLSINFLRRPRPAAVVGEARILKAGSRLVYGEVMLTSEGMAGGPVAHATSTYCLPPGAAPREGGAAAGREGEGGRATGS